MLEYVLVSDVYIGTLGKAESENKNGTINSSMYKSKILLLTF